MAVTEIRDDSNAAFVEGELFNSSKSYLLQWFIEEYVSEHNLLTSTQVTKLYIVIYPLIHLLLATMRGKHLLANFTVLKETYATQFVRRNIYLTQPTKFTKLSKNNS